MKKYALSVSVGDRELCFIVEGRIDSTSIRDFGDTIAAERRKYPHGRIVFDCSELEYISSAGLRVLLSLKKKERNPIRLINVPPDVHETLEVTGFWRSSKLRGTSPMRTCRRWATPATSPSTVWERTRC